MKEFPKLPNKTTATYVVGFVLSIILTLAAFKVVDDGLLKGTGLMVVLIAFALLQLAVQLLFFLHLDREAKPRWNLQVLVFAAMVLLIIVLGSLWIMSNLNYHMGGREIEQQILEDEGIDL